MPPTSGYRAVQLAEAEAMALPAVDVWLALAPKPECRGSADAGSWLTLVMMVRRAGETPLAAASRLAGYHRVYEHRAPRPPKVDTRSRAGL